MLEIFIFQGQQKTSNLLDNTYLTKGAVLFESNTTDITSCHTVHFSENQQPPFPSTLSILTGVIFRQLEIGTKTNENIGALKINLQMVESIWNDQSHSDVRSITK